MKIIEQVIAINRVKCTKCGDIIESVHGHDFRSCSCGAISVDGGHNYLRRVGDINGYIEMSGYGYEERIVTPGMEEHYKKEAILNNFKIIED